MRHPTDQQLAYAILRIGFGVNLAFHGINRIFSVGVATFAHKTAQDFSTTALPRLMVVPFGYMVPFVELAIGILLLVGAFTRVALIVGSLLMIALMLGTALQGEWNILGTQLLYAIVYYLLLSRRGDDAWGVDALRHGRLS